MNFYRLLLVGCAVAALLSVYDRFALATTSNHPLRGSIETDWVDRDRQFSVAAGCEPFSPAHTRDVLKRGQALAERFHVSDSFEESLCKLDKRVAATEAGSEVSEEDRRKLHLEARSLVREIAFQNPLLDFDKILFIKRHDSKGVFHMCDQYYGFNAVPGGGLFVLSDPFGLNPQVTDTPRERGR